MTALAEQHRAGAVEPDGQGQAQHDRRSDDQGQHAQHQVLHPLPEGAGLVPRLASQGRQLSLGQPLDGVARPLGLEVEEQADGIGQHPQPLDHLPHPALGARRHGDHDAVDIGDQPVLGQALGVAQHRHAHHLARRARQPVVEDAQDIGLARLDQGLDQPLGVAGRPDHDQVAGQPAFSPPARDQLAPQHVGQVEGREG